MIWLKPQKPQEYDKDKKSHAGVLDDNNDWIAEKKFDGWRVNITHDTVYSSAGKILNIPWLLGQVPPGIMLDGETLGADDDVSTQCGKGTIAHTPELLEVHLFDVIYFGNTFFGMNSFRDRRVTLEGLFGSLPMDKRVHLTQTYTMGKSSLRQQMWDAGKEGIILKHLDSEWKSSSRVGWIKMKNVFMVDVVIVDADAPVTPWTVEPGKIGSDGVLYPDGKRSKPWLKGYTCCHYGFYDQHGKLRIVGLLGKSGPPEEMKKWIGQVVEVKAFGTQLIRLQVRRDIRNSRDSGQINFQKIASLNLPTNENHGQKDSS